MGPVTEMMPLGEAAVAARETTPSVPMGQGPSERWGNRPGPRPDLHHAALGIVAHHHAAGIAGQALRRLRGNARALLEDRLPRLLGIRQHWGVDVDHYLVAFPRRAGIEPVMQRRHREEGEGIGLLLAQGRRWPVL